MATRTVKVNLKANVAAYISDVEAAAAATRGLRNDAQRFEDRYTATLDVNSRGANRSIKRTRRSLTDTIIKIENLKSATRGLAIPPALFASIPQLASLGASAVDAAGALNIIPAAAFAAASGIGVLAIGAMGWKDVLENLTGTQEGFENNLKKLAPEAQQTARVLRGMSKEWMRLADVVQDDLFEGTSERLKKLGGTYLPMVESRLAPIAGELGDAANAFADFADRAQTVRDTSEGLDLVREAAERIAPIMVNLSAVVRDMGIVGARELPAMADGFVNLTGRLRDFISEARRTGELQDWIQNGMETTAQWGRVFMNTGSIINSVFHAADASGVNFLDTLERVTQTAESFLDSAPGEARMIQFFTEMREVGNALLPGLRALGQAAADVVTHLSESGTVLAAAQAFSSLAEGAAPVVGILGELATTVLPPLLALVEKLGPFLGPAIAGFLALKRASGGISAAAGGLATLSNRLGGSTGAANKMLKVADTLSRRLPILGAAVLGVVLTIEDLQVKAEDAAAAIAKGGPAAKKMREEFTETNKTLRGAILVIPIVGSYLAGLVDSEDDLTAALNVQQAKQAEVTRTQKAAQVALQAYKDAVNRFGADSSQAVVALIEYKAATKNLEFAQDAAGIATDRHTSALERQRNLFLGAIDTNLRWKETVDRATESVRQNGVTTDDNTEAGRRNQRALLDMARAAVADIQAKTDHGASTREITALTEAHRQQLIKTAIQMGMSRAEATKYVDQLNLVPPDQTTAFHTPGLPEAIGGVRELSDLLHDMTGVARATLTGAVSGARARLSQITGRAQGGPIYGPGTGTSDDVLMWGSNGEFMMRKRAVDEQGMGAMSMLNAGRADIVPKGALPGRARGGPVFDDITLDFRGAAEAAKKWKNDWFPPYNPSAGVEQWRGLVLAALARHGQPAYLADRVLMQISTESGGNPNAINLWDSNARAGHPSQGLLQTIPSTFAAYHEPGTSWNITDPWANINASINYALARYGSLQAAYQGHGYEDGGVIPGTSHADDKLALAQSGERVLSKAQNRAFEELVSQLGRPTPIAPRIAGAAGGGGGDTYVDITNHNSFTETVDLDLFNQRQDFAVRSASF